jgi:phospholipase C
VFFLPASGFTHLFPGPYRAQPPPWHAPLDRERKDDTMKTCFLLLLCLGAGASALAVGLASSGSGAAALAGPPAGIHKIKHVVVVMQENRTFDEYFGTYPGADGLPPGVCVPDPRTPGQCVRPYHDPNDLNHGGPHNAEAFAADVDGGKMDGFVAEAEKPRGKGCRLHPNNPRCAGGNASTDVMGYHDARELPVYWAYARNFVLQDHLFESVASWSLPAHLAMVSAWSASCSNPLDPMTCQTDVGNPDRDGSNTARATPDYGWTDLTYLLHRYHVPWKYYVEEGTQPDCDDGAPACAPKAQKVGTPEIWNPLPDFVTVHQDGELGNVQTLSHFYADARSGNLPAVSWIAPSNQNSEHPPALVSQGQRYVASLVNAVMKGPHWKDTAIFIAWDDWGGFYDHEVPPSVDGAGYGIRVPGLLVSAFARHGYVDHQVLSYDAYLKFIEDDFLGGARLNPQTDGRPDPRPDVREAAGRLGNLVNEFDFSRPPRPPLFLTYPAP